jgi:preprotein translocase subunit SecF
MVHLSSEEGELYMRRSERIQRKFAFRASERRQESKPDISESKEKKSFYNKYYKQLLIIPAIVLLIALISIGVQIAESGSFINKGISLSSGTSVTLTKADVDRTTIEEGLISEFPEVTINIRTIEEGGVQSGLIIDSDISSEQDDVTTAFVSKVKELSGAVDDEMSVDSVGESLGSSFFRQTMIALAIGFILMAIVVFIYFKSFVPGSLVVLAALTDIIITIGVLNLFDIKVGTSGIAALLMLIGYSVETDILLTMRVLKRKENQTVYGQIISSFKTGFTMNIATLVAVLAGLLVAQSPVLREIMIIVAIGVLADMLNTWIQNAGLLRWYLERKGEN